MPAIGYVNMLEDGSYRGNLRTLSITAPLSIVPNKEKKPDSDQPDYRVFINRVEVGGGWIRVGKVSGEEYIAVSMATPEWGKRIFANLGKAAGSESDDEYALIWNPSE